jgi:sugar lactone lactonase YvrE
VHADLGSLAIHPNDMVVGHDGTAYVGHFGYEFYSKRPEERQPLITGLREDGSAIVGGDFRPASIVGVRSDGSVWSAAQDLLLPNGCVITEDGQTLIVGESVGQRYTAFPIAGDGSLRIERRHLWASLPGKAPDGCTLDAEGGIWFADVLRGEVLRVVEGGTITHRMKPPRRAFACALGGSDGRTLFVTCARGRTGTECAGKGSGAIYTTRVASPHSGRP